jgi:hypothetical protein
VEHHPAFKGGPALIIRTNADGAEDFKIVWAPLATPGRAYWSDLIPHRPGVYILSFIVLEDWLIRLEREDGLPRIVVRCLASGEEHVIAFAEEAYSLGIIGGYEFATNLLRFIYSSMTTPEEVWDYDLASRERILRKRQEIPSGHNSADYVSGYSLRPPMAKRFRFLSFTAGMSSSTARPPACSTATVPTVFRSPPRSAAIGCRLSIAASSTRSRMCVAAVRRAGAGIEKASSPRR